jgi:hypothetical protein
MDVSKGVEAKGGFYKQKWGDYIRYFQTTICGHNNNKSEASLRLKRLLLGSNNLVEVFFV